MLFCKRVKERGKSVKERRCGGGGAEFSDIGNPDGYQKKGIAGEAKRIVVKTKGIANLQFIVCSLPFPAWRPGLD